MAYTDSLRDHFKKLLAYDQWALDQLLGDLEALPTPDATALGRMAHVIQAEELWVGRLLGEDVTGVKTVWPDTTVAQCRAKLGPVGKKWAAYLETLKPEELGRVLRYKSTRGDDCELSVGGAIAHTFDHSTYHRGQIATAIKKAGGEPHSPGFYNYLMKFD